MIGMMVVLGMVAASDPSAPDEAWIHWDAQHFVLVRGTVPEGQFGLGSNVTVRVKESPRSGVGVSEEVGQANVRTKAGEVFEHNFGFSWGGLSRTTDPPTPIPIFRVELIGDTLCVYQDFDSSKSGVTIVDLKAVGAWDECKRAQ